VITLQFVSDKSLADALINWYGHGAVSHVDVVLPDGRLLGSRLSGGVQIRPPNYETFTLVKRVNLPAIDDVRDNFLSFLRAQIGKPYDMLAIAAFAADRNWRDPRHWYCSELVAAGLERAKWFPYPLSAPANKVTPQDLLLALSARTQL
jgi:hypothetical protein